jgi:hypothetical protein
MKSSGAISTFGLIRTTIPPMRAARVPACRQDLKGGTGRAADGMTGK